MQQASLLLRVLLLTPLTSAHFVVNVPLPLSNDINGEDTAPCGGSTPSPSDAVTDFHVGGDAIGLTTLHAHSSFAYRGALGTSLASPNWTVLIPTLAEYGLNGFCEPAVPAPASWAGSKGLLQVIQDAEDGVHFQVCRRSGASVAMVFSLICCVAVHGCELRAGRRHPTLDLLQLVRRLGRLRL